MNVPDMLYFTIFHLLTSILNWNEVGSVKFKKFNEIALQRNLVAIQKKVLGFKIMLKIGLATLWRKTLGFS